jgi:hypothetical protein
VLDAGCTDEAYRARPNAHEKQIPQRTKKKQNARTEAKESRFSGLG